jgi:hypothetical protein
MFHRHVANILCKCYKSRSGFYTYVASVCFQCFIYFFQTYVASVFIWMLHMFHTYVVSILTGYCICFTMVFKYFCKCFKYMFQVFHLPSAACCKCPSGCFKSIPGVASSSSLSAALPRCACSSSWCRLGIGPLPLFLDAGDIRDSTDPIWVQTSER